MQGVVDGFIKLYCRPGTGIVLGGVVVAPRASELILPVSMAVEHNLTILKRHAFATTLVGDGDRVEIVNFVGGGRETA